MDHDELHNTDTRRMRLRQTTSEDIDNFVSSRFADGTNVAVPVPINSVVCYATPNNETRNATTAAIFREHIVFMSVLIAL